VRALSTWRIGGVSVAPYASLNLGNHVGDAPQAVAENRRRLRAAARLPAEPTWLRQVHGSAVADLDRGDGEARPVEAGRAIEDDGQHPGHDAAIARRPARICAILTADCLPVLLAARDGSAVAAVHAGWRGLAGGVIAATVGALALPPGELIAWLGPCVGAERYEVGVEVRAALLASEPRAAGAFRRNERGRFLADLARIARIQLEGLRVPAVYQADACTQSDEARYFSHRRDGRTGRQASLIWLAGPGDG
jgi:YfiH family protein